MQGSISWWRGIFAFWSPSGREFCESKDGWPRSSIILSRGRLGNPMQMQFWMMWDSVKTVWIGSWGNGFSMSMLSSCTSRIARVILECPFRATRFKKLERAASDSSFVPGGVSGGVGSADVCSVKVTFRRREIEIVASAAISLASSGERGWVVKTTK